MHLMGLGPEPPRQNPPRHLPPDRSHRTGATGGHLPDWQKPPEDRNPPFKKMLLNGLKIFIFDNFLKSDMFNHRQHLGEYFCRNCFVTDVFNFDPISARLKKISSISLIIRLSNYLEKLFSKLKLAIEYILTSLHWRKTPTSAHQ